MRQKFGVMGWPVEHSLSPPMHRAAFAELGIDAEYELIATPPAEVESAVKRLSRQGFSGWNVTVPHKAAVAGCMDRLDATAASVYSVNTVAVEPGSGELTGHSTDGYGLEMALREKFDFSPPSSRLAFIGGGGATCATAVHLALQGVSEIVLVNRTLEKIERIASIISSVAPDCRVRCLSLSESDLIQRSLEGIPFLIQATSLGLRPEDPLPLSPGLIPPETAVMDMIYGHTPFLDALRKEGRRTADGLAMLLYQGVRSFTLWTGRDAPVEVMRQALQKAV